MNNYSNLVDWEEYNGPKSPIFQWDETYLSIKINNGKYLLENRITNPATILSEHDTLQAAKLAYVMARSIGIGVPKS